MIEQVSIEKMKVVAYYLLDLFKTSYFFNTHTELLSNLKYVDYHNFSKSTIPYEWYNSVMSTLNISENELLVEVAKVDEDHMHELHYHKLSHALCIILGKEYGFNDCTKGEIIKDEFTIKSYTGLEVYFPSYCVHTFNALDSKVNGSLYFLSIQSPPLVTKEQDDFYLIKQ